MEVKLKMDIDQHVRELLKAMAEGVYEKEHILAMTLLSAVAGESIFLLGPPGTAKSLVARRLKMVFKEGKAFEYLMSRFSTPDEIFGPVSISLLKSEDRYERVVDGFLPSATVVFLDEIWKAGPSIQNALLTAINERIYQNGRTTLQLPMKALIAASNELPAENEGLEALWDRFLIRMVSNCIQSEIVFYKMIRQKNTKPKPIPEYLLITETQYEEWQQKIKEVEITNEVCAVITHIRKNLKTEAKKEEVEEMDYYISDRRWKKCVHLLPFLILRLCNQQVLRNRLGLGILLTNHLVEYVLALNAVGHHSYQESIPECFKTFVFCRQLITGCNQSLHGQLQSGASVLVDALIDGCQQSILYGGTSFPDLIEEYHCC